MKNVHNIKQSKTDVSVPYVNHTYTSHGLKVVRVIGKVSHVTDYLNDPYSSFPQYMTQLVSVINLGDVGWESLQYTFFGTEKIGKLNFGNTNLSSVTNMYETFGDSRVPNIDFSNLKTSMVNDMGYLFYGPLSKQLNIDLSNLDTYNVLTFEGMFFDNSTVQNINFGSINTAKVTDMSEMFSGASNLLSLDLSNFNTANVTTMYRMFQNTFDLEWLYLGDWEVNNLSNSVDTFEDTGSPPFTSSGTNNHLFCSGSSVTFDSTTYTCDGVIDD